MHSHVREAPGGQAQVLRSMQEIQKETMDTAWEGSADIRALLFPTQAKMPIHRSPSGTLSKAPISCYCGCSFPTAPSKVPRDLPQGRCEVGSGKHVLPRSIGQLSGSSLLKCFGDALNHVALSAVGCNGILLAKLLQICLASMLDNDFHP